MIETKLFFMFKNKFKINTPNQISLLIDYVFWKTLAASLFIFFILLLIRISKSNTQKIEIIIVKSK